MAWEQKRLGIETLHLDLKNPRFPSVESEKDAIEQMLNRIPEKLLRLARDIANNGLNPTTLPAVFSSEDGNNIVKDGNRRITAIKILRTPSLVKDPTMKRKFEKASVKKKDRFSYIDCIVFDSEEEADAWVEVNHNDSGDGVGQEKWGTLMKYRDSRNHGKSVPVLEFYEMATKDTDIDENDFPITTFERIVKSKAFRDRTGWELKDGQCDLIIPTENFEKALKEIARDVSSKEFNSRTMNSAKDIENYLINKGNYFETKEKSSFSVQASYTKPKKGKTKRGVRRSTNTVIPPEIDWEIGNARIKDIFNELKTISVNQHPNTVSILLRVFVDLTVKKYEVDNHLPVKNDLASRINQILDELRTKGRITEDQKMSVKTAIKNSGNTIGLITELNQYVHNYEINPNPEWLVGDFNNLKPFFEGIYGNVNDSLNQ